MRSLPSSFASSRASQWNEAMSNEGRSVQQPGPRIEAPRILQPEERRSFIDQNTGRRKRWLPVNPILPNPEFRNPEPRLC